MRVPLLHADFEHGSFTRIAKTLPKHWPLGEQSLMQAQDLLAVLLGYNSQHHARREATADFSIPEGSVSLPQVGNAIAWRMFVRYGIDPLRGQRVVSCLYLVELAASRVSFEAAMQRATEKALGQSLIYDEAWDLMSRCDLWPESTPALLCNGLPPYKWAVYPDRSVFIWSLFLEQLEMLPEDHGKSLREAYGLGDEPDAVHAFIVRAFVPAACKPLATALADGLLPDTSKDLQWQVRWIVTATSDVLGCCILAENLGAMIPRVFPADGRRCLRCPCGFALWRDRTSGPC